MRKQLRTAPHSLRRHDCRVVSSAGSLPHMSMGVCSDSTVVESAEGSFPFKNSRVANISSLQPRCSEKFPSSCSDAGFPPADPLPDFSIPDQVQKSNTLINTICDSFLGCRTGLSHFVRQSLEPITCTVERKCASSLWPVPPPRWRWSGSLHLGPRRRRRRKRLEMQCRLLQLVVSSLNWETLGHPLQPPNHARAGFPCSEAQDKVLARLASLIGHYTRMDDFCSGDLGRSAEKFKDVIASLKELPHCTVGFEDLSKLALQVLSDLDPYNTHFARREEHPKFDDVDLHHHCGAETGETVKQPLNSSRPVVSERVKWNYGPSFEASEFLSNELIRAAFLDPEVLRKPAQEWGVEAPAKLHCDRTELLKLAQRWDDLGSCCLVPA